MSKHVEPNTSCLATYDVEIEVATAKLGGTDQVRYILMTEGSFNEVKAKRVFSVLYPLLSIRRVTSFKRIEE